MNARFQFCTNLIIVNIFISLLPTNNRLKYMRVYKYFM